MGVVHADGRRGDLEIAGGQRVHKSVGIAHVLFGHCMARRPCRQCQVCCRGLAVDLSRSAPVQFAVRVPADEVRVVRQRSDLSGSDMRPHG